MQRQSVTRIGRYAATNRRTVRHVSTTPTESLPPPTLRAAMLLHRAPLLTPTPTPFEKSYYAYTSRLRMALSNPAPVDFYYKKGSLTERRFLRAQWERERDVFGERLAGKRVDVGDIPAEEGVTLHSREEGGEGAADRTRVERVGEGNVYLLVKDRKSGTWGLPMGGLQEKEALHEAAVRSLADGLGNGMDTWLVTRKPVGLIEGTSPSEHTFIFKSHILAGSPELSDESPYSEYAWLTKEEIREAMGGENVEAGEVGEEVRIDGGSTWSQVEPLLS